MRAILVLLVAVACSDREPNAEKRMPRLAPPPTAPVPADLHIEVAVEGAAPAVVDARALESLAADFADEQRRAWRLDRLAPAPGPGRWQWVVTGARDAAIVLGAPATPADPVPVLMLSRRSEIIATLVDPARPFPAFHGEGGRLGRPGDPFPRVGGVKRISVQSVTK